VSAPLLALEDVHAFYGEAHILQGVSLSVGEGEVVTLIGRNGAGKTTTLRSIMGIVPPRLGRIAFAGQELRGLPTHTVARAGIAYVPEERRILPNLTVEENLRVATYALRRDEARSGIAYALELFPELGKRMRIPTRSLSGGEQQMVVLAQALVSRPKMILVDELSLGLAPLIVKRLVPTLESVAATGVGVLLIEQFAHVALGLANTAYVIEGGRIRYHGTAAELKSRPEVLQTAYLRRESAIPGDGETG
jgi:branched-chain amino acid transport system ATP-binding protein